MCDVIFISQGNCSRGGKYSYCKLHSKKAVIDGEYKPDRYTQIGYIDGCYTTQLCQIEVDGFENMFSQDEIVIMQNNGVLSYYPKGHRPLFRNGERSKYIHDGVADKYPAFRAEVYKKYGVAYDPEGQLIE